VSRRAAGWRVLARHLRTPACIVLTACILALLATPYPVMAAQLGEAKGNEVKHVDEHGNVHFDMSPALRTLDGHWLDCHGPRKSDPCDPLRDFPFPR
jgi:hypothetical protein